MTQPALEQLTAVVAARVRALRGSSGISQAGLGERMTNLGIAWGRTSVQKLETGKRGSVSAGELFALALVFDVPLPWLLVDPEAGTAVPIAKGVEVDPWTALWWLVGKRPLTDPPGPTWDTAAAPIRQACQVATLAERFSQVRQHHEIVAAMLPDGQDADRAAEDERQERRVLADLARPLRALDKLGFPPPPLPGDLVQRAGELGVELDGEG